jgi:hypothetical protein
MTPNYPYCNYDNLSEDCGIELPYASNQHVLRIQLGVPLNIDESLAPFTEGTLKEEMEQTFLRLCIT